MWARTTRMYATPETTQRGIDFVRDQVWPSVREMDGCIGMSMIVDRESGLGITTTSWATEEAMTASRAPVAPLREQAASILNPDAVPDVAEWEIASMHRAHHADPGACVRVVWSQIEPSEVPRGLDFFKYGLLPQIEQLPGFVSCSLLIDRAKGLGVTSVAFESRQAMEDTRDAADQMRGGASDEVGAEFLDVAEFELVFAHLHVPELV